MRVVAEAGCARSEQAAAASVFEKLRRDKDLMDVKRTPPVTLESDVSDCRELPYHMPNTPGKSR